MYKLISVDGSDKTNKGELVAAIAKEYDAKIYKFPNRLAPIGKFLNNYLKKDGEFSDISVEAIHLMFSAERWAAQESLKNTLTTSNVVADRYSASGKIYTKCLLELKNPFNLDSEWIESSEKKLPIKPDLELIVHNLQYDFEQRPGFGDEIYENQTFQEKIDKEFVKYFEEKKGWEYKLLVPSMAKWSPETVNWVKACIDKVNPVTYCHVINFFRNPY